MKLDESKDVGLIRIIIICNYLASVVIIGLPIIIIITVRYIVCNKQLSKPVAWRGSNGRLETL